jgi:hypothetical protein
MPLMSCSGLARANDPPVLQPAAAVRNHWGVAAYPAVVGGLSGATAMGLAVADQVLRGLPRPTMIELDIAGAGVFLAGAVLVALCLVGLVLSISGPSLRLSLSLVIAAVTGAGALGMALGLYLMTYRTPGMVLCGCTGLVAGAILAGGGVLSAAIHQRSRRTM